MKNKAFTLIELLIVILIIGILAAIALPQYQRIVIKTQFSEIVSALKALRDAQNRYYTANGTYTNNRDSLDIEFPLSDTENRKYLIKISKDLHCGIEGAPRNVYCGNTKIGLGLLYFYSGTYRCTNYDLDNYDKDELCKKLLNTTRVYDEMSDRRYYESKTLSLF